jgi:hypothetical protein
MIFSSSSSSVSAMRVDVAGLVDVGRAAASGTRDGADAGLDVICRDVDDGNDDAASGTRDAADIGLVDIGRGAASGTREAADVGLFESVDRSTSASASSDSDTTTLSGVDAMVGTLEAGDDDILMVSSAISVLSDSGASRVVSLVLFSGLAQMR